MIIDYANKYYANGIPTIPQQFIQDTKETQKQNDNFGLWFNDNCIVREGERIALKLVVNESGIKEKDVKEGMMRLGFKYNKDLCKIGKDEKGKYFKGGYENVMLIEIDNEETNEGY